MLDDRRMSPSGKCVMVLFKVLLRYYLLVLG